MVTVISSVQDNFGYYNNLDHLKQELKNGNINFQGYADSYSPEGFVFNTKRIYDFTRSAKAEVREDMVDYLDGVLPELQEEDLENLREAFDCLFEYHRYKEYLKIVDQQRAESMKMFVFDEDNHQYVAHVTFNSTSTRDADEQFTVHATLTCHCYDYFPTQETEDGEVLDALQNLHL